MDYYWGFPQLLFSYVSNSSENPKEKYSLWPFSFLISEKLTHAKKQKKNFVSKSLLINGLRSKSSPALRGLRECVPVAGARAEIILPASLSLQ